MNGTQKTCHYFSKTTRHVSSFKSDDYEIIRISNIVFVAVLIFPTVLLNATRIITIWKSPSLRKKLSCFVIFLNSWVNQGVGCVCIPILVYFLFVPLTQTFALLSSSLAEQLA